MLFVTDYIQLVKWIPHQGSPWGIWHLHSSRTSNSQCEICGWLWVTILFYFIGMCRMRIFLAVLRSFFHSSQLYTFSCHSSPPTILPSSLTSSCHLFLRLPHGLVVSEFIYNTLLGILFSSILCTCSKQRNLCSLCYCLRKDGVTA
jgi:hypothetical protein